MPNNLKIALMIIVTLILAGTIGFHFIEGWNVLESFYTTVMTLTTIGYGDFAPKTHGGMLFTVLLVIFGVGTSALHGGSRGRDHGGRTPDNASRERKDGKDHR